jgi:DNA repair exonuclease SbcCD ATPase subunit
LEEKKETLTKKIPDKDYDAIRQKIDDKIIDIHNILSQEKATHSSNLNKIKEKKIKLQKLQENPECPLCNTPTNADHVQEYKSDLEQDILLLQKNNENINVHCQELSNSLTEYKTKLQKLKETVKKVKSAYETLEKIDKHLYHIDQKLEETQHRQLDIGDIVTENDITNAFEKMQQAQEKFDEESTHVLYNNHLKEIFGDKGIKNYVIRKILPVLNKKMNEYLTVFEANYTIRFNEELDETLKSRNCDQFSYKNFSSGEKRRIDMALMFTLLNIAKSRSSIDCNIIILDEVLDSSMCADGIGNLMTFMKTTFKSSYPDLCTYIITHKTEIKQDNFDTVIELKKENGFTKIEDIHQCDTVIQL